MLRSNRSPLQYLFRHMYTTSINTEDKKQAIDLKDRASNFIKEKQYDKAWDCLTKLKELPQDKYDIEGVIMMTECRFLTNQDRRFELIRDTALILRLIYFFSIEQTIEWACQMRSDGRDLAVLLIASSAIYQMLQHSSRYAGIDRAKLCLEIIFLSAVKLLKETNRSNNQVIMYVTHAAMDANRLFHKLKKCFSRIQTQNCWYFWREIGSIMSLGNLLMSAQELEEIDMYVELALENSGRGNSVSSRDIRDLEKKRVEINGVLYENLTLLGSCPDCVDLKKKLKDEVAEDERDILESFSKLVVAYCKRTGRKTVECRRNECFELMNFWRLFLPGFEF